MPYKQNLMSTHRGPIKAAHNHFQAGFWGWISSTPTRLPSSVALWMSCLNLLLLHFCFVMIISEFMASRANLRGQMVRSTLTKSGLSLLHSRAPTLSGLKNMAAYIVKAEIVDVYAVWLTWWKWGSMTLPLLFLFLSFSGSHGPVLLEWPHSKMPTTLEHEPEEPGGLMFSAQANKLQFIVSMFFQMYAHERP